MKRLTQLTIASLFATALAGAHAASFTDNARVRSAEPQYENINVPRNECTSQWINEPVSAAPQTTQAPQYGGAVLGGLAGGVLGHQVGNGRGKDVATVLGVVLGAVAGNQIQNQYGQPPYDNGQYASNGRYEQAQREVQRCRTVYDTQSRITGYLVSYDYRGQQYSTLMRNNPGNSLPVRVSVEPIQP